MSLKQRIDKLEERAGPTGGTPTREQVLAELGRDELTRFEERVLADWLAGRGSVAIYENAPEEFEPLITAWKAAGGEPLPLVFLPYSGREPL